MSSRPSSALTHSPASPAGLTRGSIRFARVFLQRRWIAPELGPARGPHYCEPQVGRTRLAVSSPAMTKERPCEPSCILAALVGRRVQIGQDVAGDGIANPTKDKPCEGNA